ncbi:MAG: glycosyltransferase [Actinomycetota bacterium]|nr:glycosyltransferase [Actinomycetota bacterium]
MRVLQVHCQYRQEGGEDATVRTEYDLLRDAGHDVHQHLVTNPTATAASAASLAQAPWNARAARDVGTTVSRLRPDVVHVYNTWFSLSPAIFRTLSERGVPTVLTVLNFRMMCVNSLLLRDGRPCEDCVGTHPWRGVAYRCYRDSVPASAAVAVTISLHRRLRTWERHVDRIITATAFARARLVAGGVPPDLVAVKPNVVLPAATRTRAPSSSHSLLYVGRLAPEKGVGVMLEAWRRASPAGVELRIAGDGPLRRELEASAPVGVRFLGHLAPECVRAELAAARALLVPSTCYEGGEPIVILEALAAGTPVVASDLGGMAETLAPLGAGALVPPGDLEAWRSRLEALATGGPSLDADGARALALWGERYAPAPGLAALENVYASAIERSAVDDRPRGVVAE